MRYPSGIHFPAGLRLLLLAAVALCSLAPFAAQAGAPGANPAAIQIRFTARLSAGSDPLALIGELVVNRTGDAHLALTITEPERHTLDVIVVQDAVYASADGGAYETGSLHELVGRFGAEMAGSGPAGSLEGAAETRLASCLHPLIPSGGAGLLALADAGITVAQTDGGIVGGVTTTLLSVHASLAPALAGFASLARSLGAACGIPAESLSILGQLDAPEAQAALAGAVLDASVYTGQADDFPRRMDLTLDLPTLEIKVQLHADLTPLAVPVEIAAPRLPASTTTVE